VCYGDASYGKQCGAYVTYWNILEV